MRKELSIEDFLKKRLPRKQYEELMEDYYCLKIFEQRKHEKKMARPLDRLVKEMMGKKSSKKHSA